MGLQIDGVELDQVFKRLHVLTVRQRVAIASGLGVMLMLIFYFTFWQVQMESLGINDANIRDRHARLTVQSNTLLERVTVDAQLAVLEARLPVLKQALPSDKDLAALLDDINRLIRLKELDLVEFRPDEAVDLEVMKRVPVKVNVAGLGNTLAKLPVNIADLSRQITFAKFEATSQDGGQRWRMVGELHAFAQLNTQAAPGGTP